MEYKVTAEDMHTAQEVLKNIKAKCADVNSQLSKISESMEQSNIQIGKGISLLEVKNQMLMSYIVNLSHLMCDKINGNSIKGHSSVDRLVEIRTVLEKMRPIEQKLKYQIDKLVRTAATGIGENDPLKYKPNIDGLVSKLDNAEELSEEEGAGGDSETAKYKPPKLAAAYFDEDSAATRQSKMLERVKKRALSSSIIRDLKNQYSEAPEEIRDDYNYHRVKVDRAGKERQEYEEKYFLRMQVSKKEKHSQRQMRTMNGLNELTHFGDISSLAGAGAAEMEGGGVPSKKRKLSKKGKGGKNASKKRKKFRR